MLRYKIFSWMMQWMMPWMIIQGDHVAVQGFPWMMPRMSIQVDHVAVHGSSWMNHGGCHGWLTKVIMFGTKVFMDDAMDECPR